MKTFEQVITNKVNSIFVKNLMVKKGWSKQEAANHIVDFVTSGTKESFKSFMESI